MTQEDKELLLKDLCARLPYNVRVEYHGIILANVFDVLGIAHGRIVLCLPFMSNTECPLIEEVKPYLFPLSSMTEEQKDDCPIGETNLNIIKSNIGYGIIEIPWQLSYLFVEWCNKNHFDYRGLIEKGLANDATGLNIY